MSMLVGFLSLALGFVVLINPVNSYLAIAMWLGIAIFISGFLGLWQSLTSRNYFVHRGWLIVASIADIVIGIILMLNTMLSAAMLPLLLGLWLLYRGVTLFMQGADLYKYQIRDAGWVIFGATLIIAISLAILLLPATLGMAIVILIIAAGFIIYGISTISLSFKLLDVHRRAKALQ